MPFDLQAALNVSTSLVEPTIEPDLPPSSNDLDPAQGLADLIAYYDRRCRASFRYFATKFWLIVNPARDLEDSIAIDVMCDALQATLEGGPRQLLICCPPGVSKSLLCAVLFPAWLLLRTDGMARIMVGSYAWNFCERDSTRCRDLVESETYRQIVAAGEKPWTLRADKNSVDDWWTTAGGRRLITSVDGKSTGERVDYQIVDDPLSAGQADSEADRKKANKWVGAVLSSRTDDRSDDDICVRIIVHQRLAIDDPIGTLLAADPEGTQWKLCKLPAMLRTFDVPTHCETTLPDGTTKVWWHDPREVGAPLFGGLGPKKIERLSHPAAMGPAAVATQYFQDPADDTGATIRRGWWRFYHTPLVSPLSARPNGCNAPDSETYVPSIELPARMDRIVIACDLTLGSKKGDYNAVQAWGAAGSGRYLLKAWRKKTGLLESVAAIKGMAKLFPGAKIIIEKAANGAGAEEELAIQGIPGVIMVPAIGSKKYRIGLVEATIQSGCAFLPLGWNEMRDFVEELAGATKHDDQQDAAAYAIHELNKDAAVAWPELRQRGEDEEALARGEVLPDKPSQLAKLNALWLGKPIPGRPRDVATKRVTTHLHYWIDGRCKCGATG